MVIVCCCLASFKTFEAMRSMQVIFNALISVARELAQRKAPAVLKQILQLSDLADRELSEAEIIAMNLCEIDVLKAHNFQAKLPVSFDWTERFVEPELQKIEKGEAGALRDRMTKCHCCALLSVKYLEFVPEAIAVAVARRGFAERGIPRAVGEWMREAEGRIGAEAIEAAAELLEQQQRVLEPRGQRT
jgi:hypothetical protein